MPLCDDKPILSLFPGAGLLDRAFEECGFDVVQKPDLIMGGDVRRARPRRGCYSGVIGGPPCQDFSSVRRAAPTGYGRAMLREFGRIVLEAEPEWFVCENVSRVPPLKIPGYHVQRLDVDLAWFDDARRLRHIQFGSRSGRLLHIDRGRVTELSHAPIEESRREPLEPIAGQCTFLDGQRDGMCDGPGRPGRSRAGKFKGLPGAALANDRRTLAEIVRLQGLPEGFDLPDLLRESVKKVVGNGVPLPMGRAIARAVRRAYALETVEIQRDFLGDDVVAGRCPCGCARVLTGKKDYYDASCRKRAQRARDAAEAGSAVAAVSVGSAATINSIPLEASA